MSNSVMSVIRLTPIPPVAQLVGQADHADFRDAVELLRSEARVVSAGDAATELIVVAQARPGQIPLKAVEQLQRDNPLAGVVALLGSWCEGETRTGRPWPGIQRLYWYEFPAWWRRQTDLRAAGRCAEWGRRTDSGVRIATFAPGAGTTPGVVASGSPFMRDAQAELRDCRRGLIVVSASDYDTADVIADVVRRCGYASVWRRPGRPLPTFHGAAAGIWDGAQLSDAEAADLATFCHRLAAESAPVIALLDFPRRDRIDRAYELGAAAVLGKPWRNEHLLATIDALAGRKGVSGARHAA